MADPMNIYNEGFNKLIGIRMVSACRERAEVELTVTPSLMQPHGFLHGGVTLALLETAASAATCVSADLETQFPFGVGIDVRHKKAGVSGVIRAVATLESESVSAYSGALKQTWHVAAYDEAGDVLSEGTFDSKIVSKEYLARKRSE